MCLMRGGDTESLLLGSELGTVVMLLAKSDVNPRQEAAGLLGLTCVCVYHCRHCY